MLTVPKFHPDSLTHVPFNVKGCCNQREMNAVVGSTRFLAAASELPLSSSGSTITLFFLPLSQKKSCFMSANLQTREYQPNYKMCTCVLASVCVSARLSLLTFQFISSSKWRRSPPLIERLQLPSWEFRRSLQKHLRTRACARTHTHLFTAFPHTRLEKKSAQPGASANNCLLLYLPAVTLWDFLSN